MRPVATFLAPVVVLGLVVLATPAPPGAAATESDDDAGRGTPSADEDDARATAPRPGAGWRVVMERAVDASRGSTYQGRLLIAALDEHGPTLTEVDIAQGGGGGMRVGRAETWMVGRDEREAFYLRREAGTLLRFGNVERVTFDLDELLRKYDVRGAGSRDLVTGSAVVLAVRERGADHDRERLFVDETTGLVVRRETFAADGAPRRVVAFTELEVVDLALDRPDAAGDHKRGDGRALSPEGLDILGTVGWAVPDDLPGGFRLRSGTALPEAAGSSLHLVYTDGLYTLSVYEQFGRLDMDAVAGATRIEQDDRSWWAWPGSEPERLVWPAGDLTFTAISDAPMDVVTEAVAGLPGGDPSSVGRRLVRGLRRVGGWLWPFD